MDEYDVERFYRDAKIVDIYQGARQIEKPTIARELLGRGFRALAKRASPHYSWGVVARRMITLAKSAVGAIFSRCRSLHYVEGKNRETSFAARLAPPQ